MDDLLHPVFHVYVITFPYTNSMLDRLFSGDKNAFSIEQNENILHPYASNMSKLHIQGWF